MTRIQRFINQLGSIIFILGPMLNLFYFAWESLRNFIPLPVYLGGRVGIVVVAIIGNLLQLPAFFLSDIRIKYRIPIAIGSIPMFCLILGFAINTEILMASTQMGENRFHLTSINQIGDPIFAGIFYKCDLKDTHCESIRDLGAEYIIASFRVDLIADDEANEVLLYLDGLGKNYRLIYVYGSQPRRYARSIEIGEFRFYLAYIYDQALKSQFYMLFRCITPHTACDRIPFKYQEGALRYSDLVLTDAGELQVFVADQLIYVYGDQPRCIADGCTLTIK